MTKRGNNIKKSGGKQQKRTRRQNTQHNTHPQYPQTRSKNESDGNSSKLRGTGNFSRENLSQQNSAKLKLTKQAVPKKLKQTHNTAKKGVTGGPHAFINRSYDKRARGNMKK